MSSEIEYDVRGTQTNLNGHSFHSDKFKPKGKGVKDSFAHTENTNGVTESIGDFIKQSNGIVDHMEEDSDVINADVQYTSESNIQMNGCVTHMNGNADHLPGNDVIKTLFPSVTQSECGRVVTTDTKACGQQANCFSTQEPCEQELCERLSSVGMDDGDAQNVTENYSNVGLYDNTTDGPSIFQWTHDSVFSQDKDGDTCLHIGLILGELNLVTALINTALSPRCLSIRNNLSQTPLHLAVLTNLISAVRRLIVGGAEIDSRDRNGNTALHLACANGYWSIAATLLEPVRYHETKLNTNYEIPYQKIPQNLEIANYDGKTVLHLAVMNGHYDIVKLLIDKRADINARDGKTGRTILHEACLDGNLDLVKYLLSCKKCNINARAFDDSTPFDFARIRGHTEIAILLARAGARYSEDDGSE